MVSPRLWFFSRSPPEIHGGVVITSSDPTFDMTEGADILVWKPSHEVVSCSDDGGKDEKALFCSRFPRYFSYRFLNEDVSKL